MKGARRGWPPRRPHVKLQDYLGGMALRETRMKKGITQDELAERINISASQVAKLEAGERQLRSHYIMSFAEGLGMSSADLMAQIEKVRREHGPKGRVEKPPGEEKLNGGGETPSFPVIPIIDIERLPETKIGELIASSTETVTAPKDGNLVAFRVSEHSMEFIASPGAIVVVDIDRKALVDGERIVAVTDRGVVFRKVSMTESLRLMPETWRQEFEPFTPRSIEVVGRANLVMRYL